MVRAESFAQKAVRGFLEAAGYRKVLVSADVAACACEEEQSIICIFIIIVCIIIIHDPISRRTNNLARNVARTFATNVASISTFSTLFLRFLTFS